MKIKHVTTSVGVAAVVLAVELPLVSTQLSNAPVRDQVLAIGVIPIVRASVYGV